LVETVAGIGERVLERVGVRREQTLADMRCERVADGVGEAGDAGDRLGVVEHAPGGAGQRDETAGSELTADGVAHHVLEHVGFVEDDDVVRRQDGAAAADMESVEVRIDDDHVGLGGAPAGPLGEAHLAARAAIGTRAFLAAHAERAPRRVTRCPVELGDVPGVARARPAGQSHDLGLGRRGHVLQLELAGGAVLQLADPLDAQVVAATLEDRPTEATRQRVGQEGEVLRGELVLQRLRRGGDDGPRPRTQDGNEVGQRLARPRPGLDDDVAAPVDGGGDEVGHPLLTGPVLR
jgi:hypothetical protein